jgi:hypothetical protein
MVSPATRQKTWKKNIATPYIATAANDLFLLQ